ncbi:hypothetical protein, partial [Escherichia coli]|uniref:hypothetical protein n=4 Tax=Pseudomonadota TaxID=1224 RepID=UPI0013D72A3A
LIAEIETGKVAGAAERFLDLDRRMRASPGYAEGRRQSEQMRQHQAQAAAAMPMVDPDKGRLDPKGAEVSPRNPGSHY